ncbi:TPA: dehydrogenase, partial [Streptococcus pyogenes]
MSRNQDCKNILIIGFGKIGKIKAYKWLSRGYEVYVKDLKFSSMKYLNTNSDVLDDLSRQYFTIEICTPTNHHLTLLKTVITRYVYSYISIEKPLCNRLEDLEEMKSLVESHPHLAKKIFASEQYFFSKILEKLLQVDCFSLDKIKEITVNFSKDRIEDNENGRFLDKEILGYGIEIPHIIAVISYLGISLEEFKKGIFVNAIYIKDLE